MINAKHLYGKGLVHDLGMLTQSQFSQVRFIAKLDNIKLFYSSLKAINFHDDVTIVMSANGLKAIVEDARYVQATVYVSRNCFSEFRLLGGFVKVVFYIKLRRFLNDYFNTQTTKRSASASI